MASSTTESHLVYYFILLTIISGLLYLSEEADGEIFSKIAETTPPPLSCEKRKNTLYLVATTLFHNEGQYLKEWIEFHRRLGFDQFLLFNHESSDNYRNELQVYIESGVVIVLDAIDLFPSDCDNLPNVSNSMAQCQVVCFAYAIQHYKERARWLAVFDVDEFIFPSYMPGVKIPSLSVILEEYEEYDILEFKSSVFGSNGFVEPPPQRLDEPFFPLVLENYRKRAPVVPHARWNGFQFGYKSIADPKSVSRSSIHVFTCQTSLCTIKYFPPLGGDLRMSHYQYKSHSETIMKASLNHNPLRQFDPEKDSFLNSEYDNEVAYLIPQLKEALHYYSSTGTLFQGPCLQ
jgi:hypothetical protein